MDNKIKEVMERFAKERSNLLPLLQEAQETEKYISPETVREISRFLDLSENEIYSVASFYGQFRFTQPEEESPFTARTQEKGLLRPEAGLRPGEMRIALRNLGLIDPESIDDYISREGYSGLAKALRMAPEEVIAEVGRSGLRGRGGAGFPVGDKWRSCRDAPGNPKYLVCNAAEGDPASLTAQVLLEGDPHAVLEGMVIGAYAIGATRGYIYINDEYSLAIARVKNALKQMEKRELLGDNILSSGLGFHIEVKEGLRAFVCGEETALLRAMEGKRGMPYTRPPFPGTSGFQGRPTTVNNVETLAHVSAIFTKGSEWYAGYGTAGSKGTKVFTLAGKVNLPGVIEVPMGITLRKMLYDLGGGMVDGHEFKAVRTGGPTGGWLPANILDMPVDYEQLAAAGSIMGSGSMVVTDRESCAVDLAKQSLSLIQAESCGKCVLCREGTMQMVEILTDITEGRGKPQDVDLLLRLGEGLKTGCLCALGRTAPNPVLTTLSFFREEYEAHVKERRCPARSCKKLEPQNV